jgi:diacylglycerol kinase family enzyme
VGTLFSARTVVVMNATHRGDQDLGPRAHPNDGLLDVTDGQLLWAERMRARKRMRTGSHLPHPMLATSRARTIEFRFSRPAALEVDGRPVGSATEMSVRCVPDALVVVV